MATFGKCTKKINVYAPPTSFSSIAQLRLYARFLILFHLTYTRFSQSTNLLMCLSLVDFNIHHKLWLTYSGGTDGPGELCYNFSISNDFTQMVNFPTQIPDCDSHSPALLDFYLLMLLFVLQWLSLHQTQNGMPVSMYSL